MRLTQFISDFHKDSLPYKHRQTVLLLIAITLLLGSGLATFYNARLLREHTGRVAHTHEVITLLEEIDAHSSSLVATAGRYLLTGNSAFLANLKTVKLDLLSDYDKVLELTKDNLAQQARLRQLKPIIDARIKLSEARITLRRERGLVAVAEAISTFSGENHLKEISTSIEVLQDEERKLLAIRQNNVDKTYKTVFIALTMAALAGFALITLTLRGLRRQILERDQNAILLKNFESIIESSDDAIISKTLDGVIQSWNGGAERLFGYTAEEIIGQSMLILIPEARQDEEQEILRKIALSQKVDHFETLRKHKDGHLIHIAATISPIYDSAGRVVAASKIARDISERKLVEEKITEWAFYDTLTHLPNRRMFYDRFHRATVASERSQQFGALLLLDLDHFKPVNDKHGHAAGDQLLCEAALRIQKCVRDDDTVARLGGDEFAILINKLHTDKTEAIMRASIVAEKIRKALEKPYLLKIQHHEKSDTTIEHESTATIGLALFLGKKTPVADVLKQADAAMYRAKENGRNQVSA